jgi:carbamoyl-phosphate synthase large subunit
MNNILITSAGRRVSLVKAFQKELKLLLPDSKVYVADQNPKFSAAAMVVDKAFQICKIEDEFYITELIELCNKNHIKVIVPTLDTELLKLSSHIKVFKKNGIEIVISDIEFIEICDNKLKTQKYFQSKNIEVAKVYDKAKYKLPLFIKPKNGSNSFENYIISDENQISKYHLENKNLQFFEYFNNEEYNEYTCDIYYDRNSLLKCVIPRKRLEVRGGEISKGITCNNVLKAFIDNNFNTIIGARGCVTMQFFIKNNKTIIGIEINPRFGGGFPLSYLAGGNFPKWIIQEYLLNEELEYFDDWKKNLLMLRYDDEILVENHENK